MKEVNSVAFLEDVLIAMREEEQFGARVVKCAVVRVGAHDPVMDVDREVEEVATAQERKSFGGSRNAGPCEGQHRRMAGLNGSPSYEGRSGHGLQ